MWYSFKILKHRYIGMYPHCLDIRFLILTNPQCHHYIGMYPHVPGIGYLRKLMYPHCCLYTGMYPHCLVIRFLGKLMYPHILKTKSNFSIFITKYFYSSFDFIKISYLN